MLLRDLHADRVWGDVAAFLRDPSAPFPSGAQPLLRPSTTVAANEGSAHAKH